MSRIYEAGFALQKHKHLNKWHSRPIQLNTYAAAKLQQGLLRLLVVSVHLGKQRCFRPGLYLPPFSSWLQRPWKGDRIDEQKLLKRLSQRPVL